MKKLILALGIVSLVAGQAIAAEMEFATVDTDGDGMVTLDEATAAGWEWTEDQFSTFDADGDGSLSVEEFAIAIKN